MNEEGWHLTQEGESSISRSETFLTLQNEDIPRGGNAKPFEKTNKLTLEYDTSVVAPNALAPSQSVKGETDQSPKMSGVRYLLNACLPWAD